MLTLDKTLFYVVVRKGINDELLTERRCSLLTRNMKICRLDREICRMDKLLVVANCKVWMLLVHNNDEIKQFSMSVARQYTGGNPQLVALL